MKPPCTADEREQRFVQYVLTLNKGQLAEFKLTRLNRIANQRRRLLDLFNEMVETRAEDLAAGMLMEHAPERIRREESAEEKTARGRLPMRKRRMPPWIRTQANAAHTRKP